MMSLSTHRGIIDLSAGLSTDDSAASCSDTSSGAATGARVRDAMGADDSSARPTGDGVTQTANRPAVIASHPINWGSQQWRLMRRALRDGATIEEAAEAGDMTVAEARALAKIDADRAPLPEEAFQLLKPVAPATKPEEPAMADEDDDDQTSTEVKQMDVERFERLYRGDIKPAKSEAASQNQIVSQAYKAVDKECHMRRDAAKAAIAVFEMEEVHGDDWYRTFVAASNQLHKRTVLTFHGGDLMDMAENLATLNPDFDEVSEDEIFAQEGRRKPRRAKGPAEVASPLH